MRTAILALLALLAIHVAVALAETFPVIHYHDVINSMAETGAKQNGAQDGHVEYDAAKHLVIFRARKSAGPFWLDVRMETTFVRDGKLLRLQLLSFKVGPLTQNSSRFDEADARMAKLLAVESTADRVVILKAGQPVYEQVVGP